MARDPRHDILFEPVQIGPKTLRNRFYQVPHCTGFGTERPRSQARFRATKAEGGWAAVCTEIVAVHPESDRAPQPIARLWDDHDEANLALLCEEAHAAGALVGCQLWHGGKNVEGNLSRAATAAPSQVPSEAYPMTTPRELTVGEIDEIQAWYVAAALRARNAGFDIVYTYGAHGYLLGQFLSPFTNVRTDRYGGSLENRARFWLETMERVREAVGDDCALACRMSVDARAEGGLTIDDALAFIRLADPLVDLWDVNTGTIANGWVDMTPSRLYPEGSQLPFTARVREATTKPIVTVGRFTSADTMAQVVRDGLCDLIGAARPSIADPYLPAKIERGESDRIRECIGCNVCLVKALVPTNIGCTQNATAGEEHRRGWHPERFSEATNRASDVLVVGGGVSGMECAIVLAKRGMRRVHLVEATSRLGGYAALASQLPGLGEWHRLVDWRQGELRRLRNVEVHLSTSLDAAGVEEYGADVVVLATGSAWAADGLDPVSQRPIPGAGLAHTRTPERVLAGDLPPAGDVVVYDAEGYFMGVGMAELLALAGRSVTLVTSLPAVAPFLEKTLEAYPVRARLAGLGVEVVADASVAAIGPGSVRIARYGVVSEHAADGVVLVTARRSRDDLLRALGEQPATYAIGDCVAPRLLADAIFDGHRLGREIDTDNPRRALPYAREGAGRSEGARPLRTASHPSEQRAVP
jgi:dimethylamine/trimethylamine dehydrogenase